MLSRLLSWLSDTAPLLALRPLARIQQVCAAVPGPREGSCSGPQRQGCLTAALRSDSPAATAAAPGSRAIG
jgi:hypothetical protein